MTPENRLDHAIKLAIWILALTATGKAMLLFSHEAPQGPDPVLIWLQQKQTLALAVFLELVLVCFLASPRPTHERKGQALVMLCTIFTAYRLNLLWQSIQVCSCLGQVPLWFPAVDPRYIGAVTLVMLASLWVAGLALLSLPNPAPRAR